MNHASVLRVLLLFKADPSCEKSKEDPGFCDEISASTIGQTPLYYVCRSGHLEALLELLEVVDYSHLTHGHIHWACEMGRADVLRTLLRIEQVRNGINDKDVDGNTAVFLAACS